MKRIVKQILVLMFVLGLLQPHVINAKKCDDLILIFDPHLNESIDGEQFGLGLIFANALYEKAAPIIVSSNIVENFCFWKTEYKQVLEDIKKEALKTKDFNVIVEKANNLLSQTGVLGLVQITVWLSVSVPDLSHNDWYCYIHKQADLILLIPKDYITRRAPQGASGIEAQLEACGLRIADLDKINNVSPESVLNAIKSKKTSSPINIIDGFKTMFLIKKSSAEIENASSWDFCMRGHGGPAKKKSEIMQEQANRKSHFDVAQKLVDEARAMNNNILLSHATKYLEKMQENRDSYSPLLKSIENLSDESVVPQTASIAGVSFDEFVRLMDFCNSSIKTNLFYYCTCFGGGYNQTFVNDMLQKLNVNFIVVAEGLNETVTFAKIETLEPTNFTRFFGLLENFFGEPTQVIGIKAPQGLLKDPIATIVGTIANVTRIENLPFVRIPAVGIFTALNVDKKVKILTNTTVKAYESEGRTIDLTNQDIQTILIYPKYIQVPLRIDYQSIISPTPQTIDQLYKTTHIFEEIISNERFDSIVLNFIKLNKSYSQITFVIKKLTIPTSPQPIENLIIQIAGQLSEGTIKSSINIMYTRGGKTYEKSVELSLGKMTLKDYSNLSEYNEVAPERISSEAMRFFDKKDTKDLEGISITTLADVVTHFDTKINKEFGVQKPGALRNVLLLKQLQGLQEATTPEALQKQKDWLKESNKPTEQFVTILNRYATDLARLKNELMQPATVKSLSKKDSNAASGKIKTLEALLAAELKEAQQPSPKVEIPVENKVPVEMIKIEQPAQQTEPSAKISPTEQKATRAMQRKQTEEERSRARQQQMDQKAAQPGKTQAIEQPNVIEPSENVEQPAQKTEQSAIMSPTEQKTARAMQRRQAEEERYRARKQQMEQKAAQAGKAQ